MLRLRFSLVAALCCSIFIMTGSQIRAQAQAAQPAAQSQQKPVDPKALPGDSGPMENQPDQLKVPLGPPPGPNPSPKKIDKPILTYELALEAATAAMQSCLADNYPSAVAVSDEFGNIRVGLSSDGMLPGRIYVAARKTLAAITFKVPTSQLRVKFAEDPSLMSKVTPNMALLPGALPIMAGDRLVGAIAVTGSSAYEEEKCGGDGIARIQARLK